MIKTILAPSTASETDTVVFAAAATVARLFGAHVDALHVRLDPVELAVAMSTEGTGGTLLEGIIERLSQEADAAETKARAGFTQFCKQAGVALASAPASDNTETTAQFHVETGREERWMVTYGLTSDLAVASRGVPGSDATARATLETLLLETGRPLLIPGFVPLAPDFADRITVAWKPTTQAARAVASAMPFLARAREITVLTVEEEEGRRDDAQRVVDYLGWHGIKSTAERLSPGAEGAAARMLDAATAKASLLVMGGYGRSRLREWVFGGFTQSALDHAELPVLMAH
jgi:nucleotide-binding universal stress UspA family protein